MNRVSVFGQFLCLRWLYCWEGAAYIIQLKLSPRWHYIWQRGFQVPDLNYRHIIGVYHTRQHAFGLIVKNPIASADRRVCLGFAEPSPAFSEWLRNFIEE